MRRQQSASAETIRVVARFRPIVEQEAKRLAQVNSRQSEFSSDSPAVEFLDDGATVSLDGGRALDSDSDRRHFFTFDSVLPPDANQADVYAAVARPRSVI